MKTARLNLCTPLRNSIVNGGWSTVKIVNAVNAALGELGEAGSESKVKLGDGRITKTNYKVTETETIATKYSGDASSVPLRFDAFNGVCAKLEKVASFESLEIPELFTEWFDKFAKASKDEQKAEVKA